MSQVADRYCRAVYSLLEKEKTAQAVLGDLLSLKQLIAEDKHFASVLKSRRYGKMALAAILKDIADKGKFHQITKGLLEVIALNGRLQNLEEIIAACEEMARQQAGEQMVTVVTAQELSKAEAKELASVLEKNLKKKIILAPKVDESLIGGISVRVGSILIDNSYRTKLQQLHHTLKGV